MRKYSFLSMLIKPYAGVIIILEIFLLLSVSTAHAGDWSVQSHQEFSRETQETIATLFKLHELRPNTELARLPFEMLFEINAFVAGRTSFGFVKIPGGEYDIGSPLSEADRSRYETLHTVALSEFEIMVSAVTQEQYAQVMGTNPSRFNGSKYCPGSFRTIKVGDKEISICADHPVETVSWDDATKFAEALSGSSKVYNYALPTEAQLETAFRGGTKTAFTFGDDASNLKEYVRYRENSDKHTWPVNSLKPNDYGIYRGGGVWEWTEDWYGAYDPGQTAKNPTGPASGWCRVIRGGGWYGDAPYCRAANRSGGTPEDRRDGLGFRLVRTKK